MSSGELRIVEQRGCQMLPLEVSRGPSPFPRVRKLFTAELLGGATESVSSNPDCAQGKAGPEVHRLRSEGWLLKVKLPRKSRVSAKISRDAQYKSLLPRKTKGSGH